MMKKQIMGLFLKQIVFMLLIVHCVEGAKKHHHGHKSHTKKGSKLKIVEINMYSRHDAQYRTWNCTNEMDDSQDETHDESAVNNEFLKYDLDYKGIGKLSTPEECARTCTKTSLPKNCYYKFTIEYYRTYGGACDLCRPTTNTSLSSDCQCIEIDGVEMAGIMVINRMLPGPSIQVCLGDLVIVDVVNDAPGAGVTIHWHGLYQKDWQYYDGTPYVTQCPINSGETFRYKWRAQNVGTHFYHAHTGLHKLDGVEGAVIIRVPESENINGKHCDEDNFDNVISIKDWFHEVGQDHWPGTSLRNSARTPDNVLINGKGQWFNSTVGLYTISPLAVFNVKKDRRYRFRMINNLDCLCVAHLTIQHHNLTLIAADGDDIEPITVTTISSFAAERYDFVLDTHHKIGTYWIQVRLFGGDCDKAHLSQVAVLKYIESPLNFPETARPSYSPGLPLGIQTNDWNESCNGKKPNIICPQHLRSAENANPRILASKPDITLYLPYNLNKLDDKELFLPNTYTKFELSGGKSSYIGSISGISNLFPASPYLTQYNKIDSDMICDDQQKPGNCNSTKLCSCSHLINIPLNSMVEMIALHSGDIYVTHPFHLHGYGFHIMAQGSLDDVPITYENKHMAWELHQQKYGKSHNRPAVKDTVSIAPRSYTIMRFIADNPGFWLYHCHIQRHLLVGMSLVLHMGNATHLPRKPKGFPKCGSFVNL